MVLIGVPVGAAAAAVVPPVVVALLLVFLLEPHADSTSAAISAVTTSARNDAGRSRRSPTLGFFMLSPRTRLELPTRPVDDHEIPRSGRRKRSIPRRDY